jgi:DNA-binding transcriptional LysR family regulator
MAVFDELRQGVKDIEFLRDPTVGEVRIGAGEPLATTLVTRVIERLSRQYPRISFHVVHDDPVTLLRHLEDRVVDLVLARMFNPSVEDHMKAEVLYHDRIAIVAGAQNPLTRRRKVALAALVNEPWVFPGLDTPLSSAVLEAFRASGHEPPRPAVVARSLSTRNSLLATGLFLSAQPAVALKLSRNYPAIKALPAELPTTRRATGLVTLKGRALSPVVQLFINCARDTVKSVVAKPHARTG